MTLPEVAAHLGVPVTTIYAWRHAGVAPRGMRVGKHIRVRRSDLDAWMEAHLDDTQPSA
jgi:excisionase family DNA binding protein